MENPFAQLRFDISEKVRLHPQQPGIDTLLEMDLYPDVEIKDEGQHLKIQGYLRLSGTYLAKRHHAEDAEGAELSAGFPDGEEQRHELAYVIPVEITLPADRAEQERILAEVESFDYSLLSPFELKIEAILMIDGLIPEKTEAETFRAEEEEIPEAPVFSGAPARPLSVHHDLEEETESPHREREEDGERTFGSFPDDQTLQEEDPYRESVHPGVWMRDEFPGHSGPENPHFQEEREDLLSGPHSQTPGEFWRERQESKLEPAVERFEPVREPADEAEEDFREEHRFADFEPENRQTEWIRWLVGNKPENFTPMRMVIVRKDESIDQLASRYDVSANQLIRMNRLKTDRLEEGQILHVPCRKDTP